MLYLTILWEDTFDLKVDLSFSVLKTFECQFSLIFSQAFDLNTIFVFTNCS